MKLKMVRAFYCVVLLTFTINVNATGENVYRFLKMPYYAKLAGLGGSNVSAQANDVNQIYYNPALFPSSLHQSISLSYVNYLADANGGMVSYAYCPDSLNCFGFNFVFIGYGDMEGYDTRAFNLGQFSAGDFAWNLTYARYLGANLKVGLSLKPVYSHIDTYGSFGLAFGVGANYYHPDWNFSASMVVSDFGVKFTDYYDGQGKERLPWNMQIGLSKGLSHAPFRFSVTYNYLNRWNFDYEKAVRTNSLYDDENNISGGDMFFRHLVFGVEALVSKYFHVDLAYNHRRNREYGLPNARGINGFSFGAGFKVYKFNLDAAFAKYAPSGGTFTLSLSSSIDYFKKQRNEE